MRTSTRCARLLCATFLTVATANGVGAQQTPATGDLARMQGKWTAMADPEKNLRVSLAIEGHRVQLSWPTADGTRRELKGEIQLDEKATPEKTLDWVKFSRPDGQPAPPNLAIYRLDGDTLTICSGGPGGERPTAFQAGEGNRPSLIVLKKD